jgi:hypothetical protein
MVVVVVVVAIVVTEMVSNKTKPIMIVVAVDK